MKNICSKCGAPYADGQKFCRRCGNKLAAAEPATAFCPECGAKCLPDDDFCLECGTRLKAEASVGDSAWDSPSAMTGAWETPATDEWGTTLGALSAFEEEERFSAFEYEKRTDGSFIIKSVKDKYALSIVIPEGVSVIADSAFENANAMDITLPNGLNTIGRRAFYNCNNLSELTLPESVMIIGEEAFADSEGLTVKLSGKPRVIGEGAFRGTVNGKKEEEERERIAAAEREAREAREREERAEREAREKAEREAAEERARLARFPEALAYIEKNAHSPRPSFAINEKIFTDLRELSISGSHEATLTLAKCALMGVGMRRNRSEALSLLNMIYSLRDLPYHGEVAYLLGEYYSDIYLTARTEYYMTGFLDSYYGFDKDFPAAEKYYLEALECGYADAAFRLKNLYWSWTGRDHKERSDLNSKYGHEASKLSSPADLFHHLISNKDIKIRTSSLERLKGIIGETKEWLFAYGVVMFDDGNKAMAQIYFKKAAELGHDMAALRAVSLIESGTEWWNALCAYADRGSALCTMSIGAMYTPRISHPNKPESDNDKAIEYFNRALSLGYRLRPSEEVYTSDRYDLVIEAYEKKFGLKAPETFEIKKRWVEDEPWNVYAYRAVVLAYGSGHGTNVDKKKAFEYAKRGVEIDTPHWGKYSYQGCAEFLATFYYDGEGTEKNPALALEILLKCQETPWVKSMIEKIKGEQA